MPDFEELVERILEEQNRDKNPEAARQEATEVLEEMRSPTVLLVSDNFTDLADELESISLRCKKVRPSEVGQLAARSYPDFHYIGIITDTCPDHSYEEIIDRIATPCVEIRMKKQANGSKPVYTYHNLDRARSKATPEHEIIKGIFDAKTNQPVDTPTPDSVQKPQLNVSWILNRRAEDPENPDAHYQLGKWLLMNDDTPSGRERAFQEFYEALRLDPNHEDTILTVLQMQYDEQEAERLRQALPTQHRGSDTSLLKKTLDTVVKGLRGEKPETPKMELGRGLLELLISENGADAAVKHLEDVIKKDPLNIDAYIYLLSALMKRQKSGDKERAHEIALSCVGKTSEDPYSELHLHRKFGSINVGPRLIQIIGLHEVQSIMPVRPDRMMTKHRYFKVFSPETAKAARAEHRTLTHLSYEFLTLFGTNERLYTPYEPELLEREGQPSILMMPRMPGKTVGELAETEEKANRHLYWITDATAVLQLWGKHNLQLEDCRDDEKEIPHIGTADFFTSRAYTRFLQQFKDTNPLSEQEERAFLQEFQEASRLQLEAPEWLWLFHTDANLHQFLIEYTGPREYPTVDEMIENSLKQRVDLEGTKLCVGMADIITPLENEVWQESWKTFSDSLVLRWLGHVMYATLDSNTRHFRNYETMYREGLKTPRKMKEAIEFGLANYDLGTTFEGLMKVRQAASYARHITVSADKQRECQVVQQLVGHIEQNPAFGYLTRLRADIHRYQEEQSNEESKSRPYRTFLRRFAQEKPEMRGPKYDSQLGYLELLVLLESLPIHRDHHLSAAMFQAQQLGMEHTPRILHDKFGIRYQQ